MDRLNDAQSLRLPCSAAGCGGHFEPRQIDQAFRKAGRLVVVEGIPGFVCDMCGETLLDLRTVERIQQMLEEPAEPPATAPLFKFAA